MPPVLDPANSKVDGLAFLGLSLARNHHGSGIGHGDSVTHQQAFDLNDVLDRNYDYLASTDDSGWYVRTDMYGSLDVGERSNSIRTQTTLHLRHVSC